MTLITEKKKTHVLAWCIWSISAVFFFYKYALEVSPSVMTDDLMRSFQIGGMGLGHLASSYFYAYTLMQTPVGLLLDRFGPRRVTTLAIIFCALGALFFSRATELPQALITRFLIGLGASFAAINIFKLSANWFPPSKFAFMVGLSMTMGMLGAVGGEEPLAAFIHLFSWRTSLFVLGIIGLILAVFFFLIVRDSPDHKKTQLPKQHGLFKSLKQLMKKPENWIISIYSGLLFAPLSVFGGLWGVPFLQEAYDLPKELSARYASLVFIGFAIGAPFFGWLSDKLNRRLSIMMIGTFLSFLTLLSILYLHFSFIYFETALLGFFLSAFLLSFTVIKESNSSHVSGAAMGLMNTFNALFVAFANPFIGKLLDRRWDGTIIEGAHAFSTSNYQSALLTLPLFCLIGLILLICFQRLAKKS